MKKILSVILSVVLVVTLSFGVSMLVSADGTPTIVVSSASATAGSTAEVTISLKDNPGIASLKLDVAFSGDLELVSFGKESYDGNYIDGKGNVDAEELDQWVKYDVKEKGGFALQPKAGTASLTATSLRLNWVSPFNNIEGDFKFATLKFKVKEGVELGEKPVSVSFVDEDGNGAYEDVFKLTDDGAGQLTKPELVTFAIENGKVTVTDVLKGDVNGDGEVTSDDAIYLLYYTLMPDLYPVNQSVDFNADSEVTSDDAIYLLYYTLMPDLYPL
ncbi:MAG: dockerin type I repeat-containing protein [Clostridia bacterium]|nr:dockerin type I repeat-containing protein [Clostridia bacterium]